MTTDEHRSVFICVHLWFQKNTNFTKTITALLFRSMAGTQLETVTRGLPDYINPGCRILFVGLNPGLRSASVGHHFAGYSNRFWKLMVEAGFLPAGSSYRNDSDLPAYGLGLTNLVSRPTAGANDLGPRDFAAGRKALLLKIRRFRPKLVAAVGVMVFRELLQCRNPVRCGLQPQMIDGIGVFVLPNPSGRNAHFSYTEMLRHFRGLRRLVESKTFTLAHGGQQITSAPGTEME